MIFVILGQTASSSSCCNLLKLKDFENWEGVELGNILLLFCFLFCSSGVFPSVFPVLRRAVGCYLPQILVNII